MQRPGAAAPGCRTGTLAALMRRPRKSRLHGNAIAFNHPFVIRRGNEAVVAARREATAGRDMMTAVTGVAAGSTVQPGGAHVLFVPDDRQQRRSHVQPAAWGQQCRDIGGYFGNGTTTPTRATRCHPPYAQNNYTNENFPGLACRPRSSASTAWADTVGFWADALPTATSSTISASWTSQRHLHQVMGPNTHRSARRPSPSCSASTTCSMRRALTSMPAASRTASLQYRQRDVHAHQRADGRMR